MSKKPVPKTVEDEPGADERFDRAIKNALITPPKPHKAPKASETGELSLGSPQPDKDCESES